MAYDVNFIFDRDPSAPEVLLVVADLVQRDETRHDVSLFRLGRFASRKPQ